MKKIFSVPLNVNLDEKNFGNFKKFIYTYKNFIYDVYFTIKIPPFNEDAYGGISQGKLTTDGIASNIDSIITIQNECNITISATFNNIYVSPSRENLYTFIKNFSPLYEMGIRSITLPFSSWVYSAELKNNFPNLFIKNTVIWKVHSAREFWNLAETGFDYINLDRTLLRDQKTLIDIHDAREKFKKKTGKKVLISILANEFPCSGFCPFREEHSSLASTGESGVHFFPTIFNICLYNHMNESQNTNFKMNFLKMAFVSPFEEDFEYLQNFIDVFKLFGRIERNYFQGSLNEIERYAAGGGFLSEIKKILTDISNNNSVSSLTDIWRREIANCNFNCWKCNLCDKIYENLTTENRQKLINYKIY